jgi:hypothetical protein
MVLVDTRDAIGALDDLSFKGAAAAAAAAILSTVDPQRCSAQKT